MLNEVPTSLVATVVRHAERKSLQIHNLYIVVIKGTKNPTAYAVVTATAALVDSQCGKWGISSVGVHSIPRIYF
jgi:hypothetical protein